MKKALLAAAAMAGVLLLGACSSDETDAVAPAVPTSESVAVSETAAPPSGSEAPTTETPTTEAPTTDDATTDDAGTEASVVPADLDETTVAWMSSFCIGFGELGNSFAELAQGDATDTVTYSDLQTATGTAMSDLGTSLAALPAPNLTDGENLAGTFASLFTEQGAKLVASGAALAADTGDAAAASVTASAVTDGVDEAIGSQLASLTDLTEAESAGIEQIPECGSMTVQAEDPAVAPTTG